MSPSTTNLFLHRPRRRRIAAFVAARFPVPGQVFAYEMVRDLARRLDADFRIVHAMVADPGSTPIGTKVWLEHGLLSPCIEKVGAADADHFQRSAPQRWQTLVDGVVAATGLAADELLRLPDFAAAVSHARWVEAWAPDLVVAFFAFEGGLAGRVACSLLDLPLVLYVDGLRLDDASPWPRVQSWNLRDALSVVVPGRGVANDLLAADATVSAKIACMEDADWGDATARAVEQALVSRPPAAERRDLGIAASVRTRSYRADVEPGLVPFVVLGAERTGSNLLIDMLLSHGQVTSAGEVFNTQMIDEGRWDTQLHADVDPRQFMELRTSDPGRCIDLLFTLAARAGNLAAGFKLLYFHGIAFNRVVDHLLAMPALRVVHLVRHNRLARWVSQVRAVNSNVWWVASDAGRAAGADQVVLPPTETLENLLFVEQLEHRFRAAFANHTVLDLSYEEMAAGFEVTGARVLDFLGVARRPLQVLSQKTGDRPLRSMVANWQELQAAFRGTRWRHLFDE